MLYSQVFRKLFFMFVFFSVLGRSFACDLSELTLTSLVPLANGSFEINVSLCIGAGTMPGGNNRGADNATGSFAFGFQSSSSTPLTIAWSPDSVSSDTTQVTLGALSFPAGTLGFEGLVVYSGPSPHGFTCVNTVATCGLIHQQCMDFTFVTNILPDSIQALGIEGNGNILGGCYPNHDMRVRFISLPVRWGTLSATTGETSIQLQWLTYKEFNNQAFQIFRSDGDSVFEAIGEIPGAFNSTGALQYTFTDPHPKAGTNLYKVRQVDIDGNFSETPILEVHWSPKNSFEFRQIRYSAMDRSLLFDFRLQVETDFFLNIYDVQGRPVHKSHRSLGYGEHTLALENVPWNSGLYFIEVKENQGSVQRKKVLIF